jgi:hypothetical protein
VEADGSGVNAAELAGQYWNVTDGVTSTGNLPTNTGTIAVTTKAGGTDKPGSHTFQWGGGSGSFSWDNS